MMVSGELQATIHYLRDNNLVDRSRVDLDHHPDIKTLFPDPIAEGARFFKKTGIFPINHGMVIRRELAEKHPWIVLNLLKAYDKANEIANQQRIAHVEYHVWSGLIPAEAGKALREPAIRHGIKANLKTLETAAIYSHEQGLTPRLMKLEELFAPSAMGQ
jgi:4,5-dihydroxyphthalate decarboxylase